ncbi:MAG: 1-deoxy-D-xylulose-5-phosphate reductoisomerase [Deltaproteobacteria bacterium]|nr:MAG: 1-deoxy-D-xylulose-5-phosphate reductoisomerase [Deltaproteobacteria bacterium]
MKRSLAILGATGSIGENALEVVRQYPERFRVVSLSAHKNVSRLVKEIETFHPDVVAVTDLDAFQEVSKRVGHVTKVLSGEEGAIAAATYEGVDLVVSAMVGAAGLRPTLAAIQAGKDIALANKETLVIGGELIMPAVKASGIQLIPIDSEHSAIFQSVLGHSKREIRRLILTASGGPFRTWSLERMKTVTPGDALRHPNWEMGAKVTIDSATMMNKGLEVIEAHWLFGIPPEKIEVLVHPESIVHSMVEYLDGVIMAQLGIPDMRIPIAYALGYPERMDMGLKPLDLVEIGTLTFEKPNVTRFPALRLAYEAIRKGQTFPAVMNAANEIAVSAFLEGRISFLQIPDVVSYAMTRHEPAEVTLKAVLEADREGRTLAENFIEKNLREAS